MQMDMQGLRNMKHLEVGVNSTPAKRLMVGLHYEFFELYDATDGWYGCTGTVNTRVGGSFVDATGAHGKDVGQEVNFYGTYDLNKDLQLMFGIAAFQPGGFIKGFNGSDTVNQYWGYFGICAKY